MRSGKLDRVIRIDSYDAGAVDEYGTPTPGFSKLADMRAQIVQSSTEEYIRNGAVDETVIIFRTRYIAGVSNASRVTYLGENFNVKEVKEIGRHEGLELRCLRLA